MTTNNKETNQKTDTWQPRKLHLWGKILFLCVIIAGVLTVLYAWQLPPFHSAKIKTNNAYVRGNVTLISPKVNGYIEKVFVNDYATVEAGQPLVQIEKTSYQAQVDQAEANLAKEWANLEKIKQQRTSTLATVDVYQANIERAEAIYYNAKVEMKRQQNLLKTQSTSQQNYDTALATLKRVSADLSQAKAQKVVGEQEVLNVDVNEKSALSAIKNAEASLVIAKENLANTLIKAQKQGILGDIRVKEGQYVAAGSALIYLVPPQHWVVANLKEKDTAHLHIGQPATIAVDAFNGQVLKGKVSKISPATGSEFSLNRSDNSTGNFIKIAQRIPVKIEIDPNQENFTRLIPGMSVVVEIDAK